jgi:quercetin dioxygenase-like cupin family protein
MLHRSNYIGVVTEFNPINGGSMKRVSFLIGIVMIVAVTIGTVGSRIVRAEDPLKAGTILQRTHLVDAKGLDAVLVLRTLAPGGESGKHTQSGNEIVYILDGSVVFELEGNPPKTLKAGEAFTTSAGQVHNVKNASSTEPAKALAFYTAKKGATLQELSVPAK